MNVGFETLYRDPFSGRYTPKTPPDPENYDVVWNIHVEIHGLPTMSSRVSEPAGSPRRLDPNYETIIKEFMAKEIGHRIAEHILGEITE